MPSNIPPSPAPLPPISGPPPVRNKTRWVLYGCGTLAALALLIVATVLVTIWWIQRPIKPVVLSASEKAVVDQKIRRLSGGTGPESAPAAASKNASPAAPAAPTPLAEAPSTPVPVPDAAATPDRPYVPGSKVLKLTEREINGLLNANTEFGHSVRLEFGRNAINAYLAIPIPQDFPIGGGKMFRARGRFLLSLGQSGAPYAILEDVTVFGLSLPKDWLAGLKGEDLIARAMGGGNRAPVFRGIKSLHLEPGALVLEVTD